MSRSTPSQISFADWELMRQGLEMEPVLQGISDFLDNHNELIEAVRQDLERGLKKPETGRRGLTPSQTLRSLVLCGSRIGITASCANESPTASPYASSRISTAKKCRRAKHSI